MQCPFCHAIDTKVVDSRLANEGEQVRRRRECIECNERFTTYEVAELSYPRISKRNACIETFQIAKLRGGITRALEKRPVSTELIENAISQLLSQIRNSGERELSSALLGEWVMESLKGLDQVAYVRFASVYRRFADLNEFQAEINRLQES